jgi:phospholipid/cholesterol/gamma-HCH transport system substrate-binding protein
MKNTLETRLGVFFALALVVAVLILEMIGAMDWFRGGYFITANFKTAQDLKRGDFVKMAGVEIGRVERIELDASRAKITMKIQKRKEVSIRTDAKAVIKFTGLMGQNFISIEAGSATAPVIQSGSIETIEQPDLSVLMTKLEGVAGGIENLTKSFSTDNLSSLMGPLTDFIKQNSAPLTAVIGNMKTVSDSIAQGRGSVGKLVMDEAFYNAAYSAVTNIQYATSDIKSLTGQADGMITQVRSLIDGINSGKGTLGKLTKDEALYTESTAAMSNLREILQKMNQGQGTVGKLINDDSFLKNAKLSLQKLDKATDGLEDQGPLSILGLAIGSLF